VLLAPSITWFYLYYRVCRLRSRQDAFERHLCTQLPRLVRRLGPAAVKCAQIGGARPDLLPARLVEALSAFHDQNKAPSGAKARRYLEQAFGRSIEAHFEWVDFSPRAAGSIAFVLHGRTLEGDEVALKVVRPGVRRTIDADLRFIGSVARLVGRSRRLAMVPMAEVVAEFSAMARDQCRMTLEAANMARLTSQLDPEILCPRALPELSTDEVLVMTYVDAPLPLLSPEIPEARYRRLSLVLLREVFRMIFVHGLVHGDLHPGNVKVARNGSLVLFDFGLVAELRQIDRRRFREMFLGVVVGDARLVALSLIESAGRRVTDTPFDEVVQAVRPMLARRTGQRAGTFLVAAFVRELFEIQRRFGLSGVPGFANAVWALAMYEGLVRARFPDLDFQAEALRVLMAPYDNIRLVEPAISAGEGKICQVFIPHA